MSIDDIDKFEQKEMKKIKPIKNSWYNWLFNYIPEPVRTSVDGFKDKVISLLRQIDLNKQYMGEERN